MSGKLPSVSRSELEVLKTLWRRGPPVPSAKSGPLSRRASGSTPRVQTLLQRLEGKGFVGSHKRARARVYVAAVTRQDLVTERLDHLSRELCDGSSVPLVRGLVSGSQLSIEEIAELRSMLDDIETKQERGGTKECTMTTGHEFLLSWLLESTLVGALLAGLVWLVCRYARPRPSVCHALWLCVAIKLVTPAAPALVAGHRVRSGAGGRCRVGAADRCRARCR